MLKIISFYFKETTAKKNYTMNNETLSKSLNADSATAASTISQDPQEGIENLLRQLHGQIKSSDWLQTNTADKLEQENPELIKAWKDALGDKDEPK